MNTRRDHHSPLTGSTAGRWLVAAFTAFTFSMHAHGDQGLGSPPEPELDGADPASRGGDSGSYWVGPSSDDNCMFDNIQDAINAAGEDRDPFTQINIRIAGSNYSQQRLSINLDNFQSSPTWHLEELRIIGGYTSCQGSQGPGNSRTTLNANAIDPFHRVFSIFYQNNPELERTVVLENLNITGGRVTENEGGFVFHGGGVYAIGLPGKLSVQLRNTRVHDNQAAGPSTGGGIYVEASGPEDVDDPQNALPLLWLDDESSVVNNQSEAEGGGIRCVNEYDTDATIHFTRHVQTGNTLIRGNSALHGGGFSQQGCISTIRAGGLYSYIVNLDIFTYSGGIIENYAINRGGGIHATGGGLLQIHGVANENWGGDPDSAAWIYLNSAARGGGIYAWGEDTRVRVRDTWIEQNEGQPRAGSLGLGGGIYIAGGADFEMERWLFTDGVEYGSCRTVRHPLFGFPPRCNGFIGNHAEGRGGAVFVVDRGSASIVDTFIVGNSSDSNDGAISHTSNSSSLTGNPLATVRFTNTLIAGNSGPNRGIYSGPGGFHDIRYSTIAGNNLSAASASVIRGFSNDGERVGIFSIIGSIVHDDNAHPLTSGGDFGGAALVGCVMANGDIDDLNYEAGAVAYFSEVDDPQFLAPDNGDYRLAETSPAINYCDDSSFLLVPPSSHDLDLRERDQVFPGEINDPPNPAPGRLYDLGAFVVVPDQLFSDRFEQSD